jgi:non-ribosomal peptide synthetase component F/acyl carrier protein
MSTFVPEDAEAALTPVTAKERAVWLLQQDLPDEGVLNVSFTLRPAAALDLPALRAAVAAMVRRHENLRTLFPAVDGEPRRHLLRASDAAAVPDVQVREVSPGDLGETLRQVTMAGFDPTRDLPLRVTVLRAAGDEVVCVTASHLVFDGFSESVLRTELEAAYASLRSSGQLPADLAVPVSAPPLVDPDPANLAYWREVLAGAEPGASLDIGSATGRASGFPGAVLRQPIEPAVQADVATIVRRTSCPPSAVLLAGLVTVLSRHGAGNNMVIAVPTYGRGTPPHRAVGFYTAITGIRVSVDPAAEFDILVRQCARRMLEGLQHPGVSIEDVQPAAYESAAPGRPPLVRYLLNYLADLPPAPDAGTVLADGPPLAYRHSRMELDLAVMDEPDGPILRALYASDVFSAVEMGVLLARLQAALTAAAGGGPVGSLDLRSQADRAITAGPAGGPEPPLLADEIATSMFAAGESPAVMATTGSGLSYGALDASAAELASRLAQHGVAPGQPVGIWPSELGPTLIAVLGCWSAGCPAVLSYGSPGAPAVAAIVSAEPGAPGHIAIPWLSGQGAGLPPQAVAEDTALIMPDGAGWTELSHGSLAAASATLATELPLAANDLVAAGPSAASGAAILEVLAALAAGARILPLAGDDEAAGRAAAEQGATVLSTSPAVFEALLTSFRSGWPHPVRIVLRGGPVPAPRPLRAAATGPAAIRVTGPPGMVLASALARGSAVLGRMPSALGVRLTDRSGAPALPMTTARLLDADGADLLGVPVRLTMDGWLEALDTGSEDGATADASGSDGFAAGSAPDAAPAPPETEALGLDFVALWRSVLDQPDAGAEDNFFTLGGDSLRAARLVAQVRKRTGVKMSMRTVFRSPTPVSFAAAVRAAADSA